MMRRIEDIILIVLCIIFIWGTIIYHIIRTLTIPLVKILEMRAYRKFCLEKE